MFRSYPVLSRRSCLIQFANSAFGLVAAAHGSTSRPARPNILIILADDMGFSDIGCYGSEIATPNLDRLAADGMRFTQFYNAARCCPTRASLLTGLYPHQAGVGHMVADRSHPSYRGYLNDSCLTIGQALQAAGYHTFMAGKWHLGENRPHWPIDRGFEQYYGLISGATSYFRIDSNRTFAQQDRKIDPCDASAFYITDAFTDAAVRFLDQAARDARPFFLYLAYTCPHWPLHAPAQLILKYRGTYRQGWDALRQQRYRRLKELGIIGASTSLSPRDPRAPAWESLSESQQEQMELRMAVYAAQIERMDQGIGRVIGRLAEHGMLDNTLILFLSDNGACAERVERGQKDAPIGSRESFASYGLPWANASNTPFRLYKHWVHEGGIASPLIAHWPGRIRPNSLTHEPSHVIDLMPTCLDVAGASYPEMFKGKPLIPLQGRSLCPIFDGRSPAPRQALYWEHEGNRAVRQADWKLVAQEGRPWELYNLVVDRTETKDLAREHPARVGQLSEMYEQWARECGVVPWAELNAPR